jgi:hypothetical protein
LLAMSVPGAMTAGPGANSGCVSGAPVALDARLLNSRAVSSAGFPFAGGSDIAKDLDLAQVRPLNTRAVGMQYVCGTLQVSQKYDFVQRPRTFFKNSVSSAQMQQFFGTHKLSPC